MLGSATALYASTAVYLGVQVAYFVGYGRLLNEAVAAVSSEDEDSGSSQRLAVALMRFAQSTKMKSHIVSLVLAIIVRRFNRSATLCMALLIALCQVSLGDTIVWWRVCVLWQSKGILALGLGLITGTFGASPLNRAALKSSEQGVNLFRAFISVGDYVHRSLGGRGRHPAAPRLCRCVWRRFHFPVSRDKRHRYFVDWPKSLVSLQNWIRNLILWLPN